MKPAATDSPFAKRPDLRSFVVVFSHALLVFAPVYLATVLSVWWLPLCWFTFGFLMNGLLNLMHEAAHYHIFQSRKTNDFIGRWFLGPLAVTDFDAYRQRHWDHHRYLGETTDPKVTYHQDVRGRRMLFHILSCLLLREAWLKFQHQHKAQAKERSTGSSTTWLIRTILVHLLFTASLFGTALIAHPNGLGRALIASATAYIIVYIYGLGSLTVLAANIRAIAEHQIDTHEEVQEGMAALRNFPCNHITRLCFGAYGFGEHATHHAQPAVPYYHLPTTTATLAEKDPRLAPAHGYLRILWRLIWRPRPSVSANLDVHSVQTSP